MVRDKQANGMTEELLLKLVRRHWFFARKFGVNRADAYLCTRIINTTNDETENHRQKVFISIIGLWTEEIS